MASWFVIALEINVKRPEPRYIDVRRSLWKTYWNVDEKVMEDDSGPGLTLKQRTYGEVSGPGRTLYPFVAVTATTDIIRLKPALQKNLLTRAARHEEIENNMDRVVKAHEEMCDQYPWFLTDDLVQDLLGQREQEVPPPAPPPPPVADPRRELPRWSQPVQQHTSVRNFESESESEHSATPAGIYSVVYFCVRNCEVTQSRVF